MTFDEQVGAFIDKYISNIIERKIKAETKINQPYEELMKSFWQF